MLHKGKLRTVQNLQRRALTLKLLKLGTMETSTVESPAGLKNHNLLIIISQFFSYTLKEKLHPTKKQRKLV